MYGCDDFLQTCNRHPNGDVAHAITVLECKQYSFFIFCGEVMMSVIVINNEWEGRGMCEHICYGRATCTNETKAEVGGRPEYEVSPSSANLHELVPPAFAIPMTPLQDTPFVVFIFI